MSFRPQTGGGGALTEVLAVLTTLVAVAASSLAVLGSHRVEAEAPKEAEEETDDEA